MKIMKITHVLFILFPIFLSLYLSYFKSKKQNRAISPNPKAIYFPGAGVYLSI